MSELIERLRSALAGTYAVEREVGFGGMATVYLAEDKKHRRMVAVKVLRPDLAETIGVDRFLREIEIAAHLNHPHILPLLDSGEAEGFLYYVMPFVEGDSLRARVSTEGVLATDVVIDITKQVASAMEHAHKRDVIHRDIKPENVLFSEGLAVVTDFGIAKAVSSVSRDMLTRSGFPLGTPGYMSPEQAAGSTDLDPRTDVCSLGCVAYELLVGETPAIWTTPEEVRTGRFSMASESHRDRLDRIPGRIEQALTKALAIRPEERFSTPMEFANALLAASQPSKKIPNEEAQQIIARAASIDTVRTIDEDALSMGGVERVAAEVGIAPEQVREAAVVQREANAGPVRGGFLGVTGKIEIEREVGADLSDDHFPGLLSEIRRTLADAGTLSDTLDRSFFWEGKVAGAAKRHVQVMIESAGDNTRIQISERPDDDDVTIVPPIVATVFSGALIAVLYSKGFGPFLPILAGGSLWAGHYVALRTWYRRFLDRRMRVLSGLMDRLADLAGGTKGNLQ